jgi:pentatricopeptide repeat protein
MMTDAQKFHDRTGSQELVSWNAIMSGFSLNKQSEDAQKLFSQMFDMGLKPDHFMHATVLDTCANLSTIEIGKQIHGQIIKQEMLVDEYISSTLIDMYAKCGYMLDSLLMFEKAPKRDFGTAMHPTLFIRSPYDTFTQPFIIHRCIRVSAFTDGWHHHTQIGH